MTLRLVLEDSARALAQAGIEQPRFEAELLLRHALGLDRAHLYLRLEEGLSPSRLQALEPLVERRLGHEPAAYILGKKEFFGLEFLVDRRALIPRPETELLVEAALAWLGGRPSPEPCLAADVGTGCGAIAIALAHALPHLQVYATDASPAALEVARANLRRHGVEGRVHLLSGDMLEPLPCPAHLILANLPYVPDAEVARLAPEIRCFEPLEALRGGPDGLDPLRRLLAQAPARLRPGGALLAEFGWGQGPAALALARHHFPTAAIDVLPDLAGVDRVLRVDLSEVV